MWNYVTQALTALVSFAFMVLFMTAAVKRGVSVQFSMLVLSLVLTVSFAAWSAGDWGMWPVWKSAVPLLLAAGACSVLGNWAMFLATSSSANAGCAGHHRLPIRPGVAALLVVSGGRDALAATGWHRHLHPGRAHYQLAGRPGGEGMTAKIRRCGVRCGARPW